MFHPLTPQTPWPVGRSFHSAVSLLDPSTVESSLSPKLLVLWGLSDGTVLLTCMFITTIKSFMFSIEKMAMLWLCIESLESFKPQAQQ